MVGRLARRLARSPMLEPRPNVRVVWLGIAGAILAGCAGLPDDPDDRLTPIQRLGSKLFADSSLSEPAGQSCASCHDPARGFTGDAGSTVAGIARGAHADQLGARNVPTILYASYSPPFHFEDSEEDGPTPVGGQFWDGRAASLAEQALGPLLNPREMANASSDAVVAKIASAPYAPLFEDVFGPLATAPTDQTFKNIGVALAAFESSQRFHPFTSKFDGYLLGEEGLSKLEKRGFDLFREPEKGNCIGCHVGNEDSRDPQDWLFTDFTYDNLGLPRNAAIPDNLDVEHFDLGLCAREQMEVPAGVDRSSLCGAFKVPTLRNIELTAPYGHNGRFAELRDIVRFYVTRDTSPELWYGERVYDDVPMHYTGNINTSEVPYDRKQGEQPRLSDDEIDAIVAFLLTLTDR